MEMQQVVLICISLHFAFMGITAPILDHILLVTTVLLDRWQYHR